MPAYRSLVDEVTRGARGRAARAAQTVLATAGLDGWATGAGEKVAQLADEVGQASRVNRELIEQLVSTETARVAARLGLVPQQDLREAQERLAALTEDVAALRLELDELRTKMATLEVVATDLPVSDEDVSSGGGPSGDGPPYDIEDDDDLRAGPA